MPMSRTGKYTLGYLKWCILYTHDVYMLSGRVKFDVNRVNMRDGAE
jgi:hypothetical protein